MEEPYGNIFGLPRRTCRLCGECDIGCNDGAKNTLDHTYLSKAARTPAPRLSPLSEVKELERDGDHFVVRYVVHEPPPDPDAKRPPSPGRSSAPVQANKVVLAAGTFGSTFLLLTNAKRLGLPSGPALGLEVLGQRRPARLRDEGRPTRLDASTGPVITRRCACRTRSTRDGPAATSAPTSRTPATRASPTGWWSSAVSAPS